MVCGGLVLSFFLVVSNFGYFVNTNLHNTITTIITEKESKKQFGPNKTITMTSTDHARTFFDVDGFPF